jgi:PhoPQ-activated pathogenicity-related protein
MLPLALLVTCLVGNSNLIGQDSPSRAALPAKTAIDDYVNKPDDSYRWQVIKSEGESMQTVVIELTSQTWLTAKEVDRPQWQHWITCAIPSELRSNVGFLYIGGGRNRGGAPSGPPETVKRLAEATGTVACELRMVPNQPLVFHNDGQPRYEDDLIGYTWVQYLKTGDATWLARNPMIKSAVRAMDTITSLMASETGGQRKVDKFVVGGGSKRGWTTWLTGAIDDRVVAIVPIVIDVLNTDVSMRHHFAAYGYWAPSIGNYVEHGIMQRMSDPRLREAYQLVDPYYYRHRLTMPKLILNAAGDQFFLPDSSQFYWDDLEGPKYLRYVPNADHGLDGTDAWESVLAFYGLVVAGREGPKYSWTEEADGSFRVEVEDKPKEVRLWQATNPDARDFRVETLGRRYTSELVPSREGGQVYVVKAPQPEKGWTAYFAELTYDVGLPVPIKLTTNVRVVPDVLPYPEKAPDLPASVTIVGTAPSDAAALRIIGAVETLAKAGKFSATSLQTKTTGTKCYINWSPDLKRSRAEAAGLAKFLEDQGCRDLRYQLESGPAITE